MQQSILIRYSSSFKRQVVSEIESGRFDNINQAQRHYGITGCGTVRRWLDQFGRNHLCPKVVRVEKPDEKNQIRELKKQVRQLKEALGQTQSERVIGDAKAQFPARVRDAARRIDRTSPMRRRGEFPVPPSEYTWEGRFVPWPWWLF